MEGFTVWGDQERGELGDFWRFPAMDEGYAIQRKSFLGYRRDGSNSRISVYKVRMQSFFFPIIKWLAVHFCIFLSGQS